MDPLLLATAAARRLVSLRTPSVPWTKIDESDLIENAEAVMSFVADSGEIFAKFANGQFDKHDVFSAELRDRAADLVRRTTDLKEGGILDVV